MCGGFSSGWWPGKLLDSLFGADRVIISGSLHKHNYFVELKKLSKLQYINNKIYLRKPTCVNRLNIIFLIAGIICGFKIVREL